MAGAVRHLRDRAGRTGRGHVDRDDLLHLAGRAAGHHQPDSDQRLGRKTYYYESSYSYLEEAGIEVNPTMVDSYANNPAIRFHASYMFGTKYDSLMGALIGEVSTSVMVNANMGLYTWANASTNGGSEMTSSD